MTRSTWLELTRAGIVPVVDKPRLVVVDTAPVAPEGKWAAFNVTCLLVDRDGSELLELALVSSDANLGEVRVDDVVLRANKTESGGSMFLMPLPKATGGELELKVRAASSTYWGPVSMMLYARSTEELNGARVSTNVSLTPSFAIKVDPPVLTVSDTSPLGLEDVAVPIDITEFRLNTTGGDEALGRPDESLCGTVGSWFRIRGDGAAVEERAARLPTEGRALPTSSRVANCRIPLRFLPKQ